MNNNKRNFLKCIMLIFTTSLIFVICINIYEMNLVNLMFKDMRLIYIIMVTKIIIIFIAFILIIVSAIHMFNKEVNFEYMTGLYSRKKLFDDLNNLISKRLQFTVCYIDFNDFKIVNDKYGHAAGDLLLKEFAKRILELKHKKIRGYRMGGDEFVIIIKSNFKVHDCIESIWKITEKEVKITMKDYTKISFAMGVIQNDFFSNADEILKKADSSMYKNKKT